MNWGKGIFISFILFASGLVVMLVITMRQELGLVAKDYYKQELAYQDQIDRIKNFEALNVKPEIKLQADIRSVVISFPEELATSVEAGEIHFFRPSSVSSDMKYNLQLGANHQQQFDTQNFKRGKWRVKLSWKDAKKEYYQETILVVR